MKRTALYAVLMACLVMPLTSCDLNPAQQKVVAQNAGLAASVTWIAYDNPSQEDIDLLKGVVGVIREVATDTTNGESYTQVLYPVVEDYLDKAVADGTVKPNQRPLAQAGALALLNGVDLLFATNPEWAENYTTSVVVVDAFLGGAETGLSLSDDDPRMVNARQANTDRTRAFRGTYKGISEGK
jgi:hypothetical protein